MSKAVTIKVNRLEVIKKAEAKKKEAESKKANAKKEYLSKRVEAAKGALKKEQERIKELQAFIKKPHAKEFSALDSYHTNLAYSYEEYERSYYTMSKHSSSVVEYDRALALLNIMSGDEVEIPINSDLYRLLTSIIL